MNKNNKKKSIKKYYKKIKIKIKIKNKSHTPFQSPSKVLSSRMKIPLKIKQLQQRIMKFRPRFLRKMQFRLLVYKEFLQNFRNLLKKLRQCNKSRQLKKILKKLFKKLNKKNK